MAASKSKWIMNKTMNNSMILYPILVNKICLSYYYFNFSFTNCMESPMFTITNDGVYIKNKNKDIYCVGVYEFNEYLKLSEKIVSKAIFQINDEENDWVYTICTISGIGVDQTKLMPNIYSFGYFLNLNNNKDQKMLTDSLWFNNGDKICVYKQNIWNSSKMHSPKIPFINLNFIDMDLENCNRNITVLSQKFVTNSTEMC